MSKNRRAGTPKKLGSMPAGHADLHARSPRAILQGLLPFMPAVESIVPGAVTVSLSGAPGRIFHMSLGLASLYATVYVVKPACKALGSVLEQWIRRLGPTVAPMGYNKRTLPDPSGPLLPFHGVREIPRMVLKVQIELSMEHLADARDQLADRADRSVGGC